MIVTTYYIVKSLLAWLITLAPTLKYKRINYHKNCVLFSPSPPPPSLPWCLSDE